MPKRAPYFHVYIGLMVVFASYAMGVTMRVREARVADAKRRQKIVVSEYQPALSRKQAKASESVCMLVVSHAFFDEANRPLRYLNPELNGASRLSAVGTLNIGFDGTGEVFLEETIESGLYIGKGKILGSGDIVRQPIRFWSGTLEKEYLSAKPRVQRVVAYFPKHRTPFPLTLEACTGLNEVVCFAITSGSPNVSVPGFLESTSAAVPPKNTSKTSEKESRPAVSIGYRSGNDGVLIPLVEGPLKQELNWHTRFSDKAAILAANDLIVPEAIPMEIRFSEDGRFLIDSLRNGRPIFSWNGDVVGIPVSNSDQRFPTDASYLVIPVPLALKLLEIDRSH